MKTCLVKGTYSASVKSHETSTTEYTVQELTAHVG